MKNYTIILFCFALMISQSGFSQSEWRVKAFFGMSDAVLLEKSGFVGGGTNEISDFYELGLRIGKEWNSKWGIESGMSFSFA